jgi:hypothetical protein
MEFPYDPCTCIENLDWEEKDREIVNVVNNRVVIDRGVQKLVFISASSTARVCFNNVAISINQGITYLCICNLRSLPFQVDITLTSDFLSILKPMPCQIPNTKAFIIVPNGHKNSCKNRTVTNLKTLAFYSLYLRGCTNKNFSDLTASGGLPETLFQEGPDVLGQMFHCTISNLVHIYPHFPPIYIPTCDNPNTHLLYYVDHNYSA